MRETSSNLCVKHILLRSLGLGLENTTHNPSSSRSGRVFNRVFNSVFDRVFNRVFNRSV